MIVTTVMVKVKKDKVEDFIKETVLNHENSVKEPGNRRFDVLQSEDDPTSFLLYEAYESSEDAAAHKETSHYKRWRDAVADWMEQPRKGIRYKAVKP
ncbi:MAG: antibiotic biosynthesis monooxygenase [Chitinispirillaceae bacterium]